MITEVQQYRIHMGDEETFGEVFRANNLQVYHRALAQLNDRRAAKAVVIESFTAFRTALKAAEGPVDAETLLNTLAGDAIGKVYELMHAPSAQAAEPSVAASPAEAAAEADEPGTGETAVPAPEPAEADALLPAADEIHVIEPLTAGDGDGEPAMELDFDPEEDEVRYDGSRYKKPSPLPRILLGLLLAIVFAWLLLGALMRGGAIPVRDLGYGWFNEHIYYLFPMGV